MKTLAFLLAVTVASVADVGAQAPAAAPPPSVVAAPAPDLPAPPADYTYSPGGRRDPFTSLTSPGKGASTGAPPGAALKGAAGLLVDELNVKGIVRSNGTYVAMVSGASGNRQTYTVKAGSRLFDGTVQSITADAVVILQQVSDPLSLQKQRQVRKPLRTQEEGK
jgi:type IV pilus assembly protein PilP